MCESCGRHRAVHVVVFSGAAPFRVCSPCRLEALELEGVPMRPTPVHATLPRIGAAALAELVDAFAPVGHR